MKLNQIDLNLFLVLEAVHRHRSITKAAEALCLTQPAVSNALNRLRQTLGDPLFVRAAGGVKPTTFTDDVIEQVREALALLEQSANRQNGFDPATSRRVFQISMNGWFEEMVLPDLSDRLARAGGGVGLSCAYARRGVIARELTSGGLDAALDTEIPAARGVVAEPMPPQALVCALAEGHPLSEAPLTLEGYLRLDHILVSARRRGAGFEDLALSRLGRERRVRRRVQSYGAAIQLVRRSEMALILPRALADGAGLHLAEPPFPLPPLQSNLYWHSSMEDDPGHRWLRTALREGVAAMSASI